MERLSGEPTLDDLLRRPLAVIFKHSTRCAISSRAQDEMEALAKSLSHPPIHEVLVVEDRALSDCVAERTGVRHASPQVIVLRSGKTVWSGSHFAITADAVRQQIARAEAEPEV